MTRTQTPVAPRSAASRGWAVVGVLGELLITLGVVLLLFVVYQLWWTTIAANLAADQAAAQLQESWLRPPDPSQPGTGADDDEDVTQEPGTAFALMYIPRLRDKVWATPVVRGVQADQLAQGIGHYAESAMPGV